jgi:TfoX/Sxy family transcriptional regulator of competence genes
MASSQETADRVMAALSGAGEIRLKKMFGEYGIYLGEKFIGAIGDDELFLKITKGSRRFLDESHDAPPYPGASMYHMIPKARWGESEWLHDMTRQVADDLPMPKPKKPKKATS